MPKFYGRCEVPEAVHAAIVMLKNGHIIANKNKSIKRVIRPSQLNSIRNRLRQCNAITEAWFWMTFGKVA